MPPEHIFPVAFQPVLHRAVIRPDLMELPQFRCQDITELRRFGPVHLMRAVLAGNAPGQDDGALLRYAAELLRGSDAGADGKYVPAVRFRAGKP